MFGFLVLVGAPARAVAEADLPGFWPVEAASETLSPCDGVRVVRHAPATGTAAPGFVWSDDHRVVVYVDGYLYTSNAPRHATRIEQVRAFANVCSDEGIDAGIAAIAGGTFNLVAVDLGRSQVRVTTDHVGSLALYHSPVPDGWLVSTNPVALARTGLIDSRPDLTAMAEWAYIGYTLGDRFMLRGIRILAPFNAVHWDARAGSGRIAENANSPWRLLPEGRDPTPGDLADAFTEACARIAILMPDAVQFQSAGKDSRLILAAWPDGSNPACYTYGDANSHEVSIARQLAALRGSSWSHVWLDGDAMATVLPRLFAATGLYVYPDRYFSARQIRQDGYSAVLDGYLGGVTIGGAFLDADKYFSRLVRAMRLLTVYVDQKVSAIGVPRITDAILDSILDVRDDASLRRFLREDFIATLRAEWPAIVADLSAQVEKYRPANDSLGALWNNVVLANRSVHSICQQMVIVRSFVDVCCPFSGDLALLRMQWRLRPQATAYKRLYIDMYRKRFRRYGEVPYGATLLPLTRPALQHKWAAILMSRGIIVPGLTGDPRGRPRDATGWGLWLRESALARSMARDAVLEGGILDERRADATFGAMADGSLKATGKVFHYAGIARWMRLSGA